MKTITLLLAFSFMMTGLFAQSTALKAEALNLETEFNLKTADGGLLSGTLSVPQEGTSWPLVLIIPGSGPTDRDCNSAMGIQTNAYKMLAESFATQGIASLRFDKRGVGKSKEAMKEETELLFETYIDDVKGWIKLLNTDKRFTKIIVLGHSEGSLIGMVATVQSTGIAAFISVSGAGEPADIILQKQLKDKLPPDMLEESDRIIKSLKSGRQIQEVRKELYALFRPSVQPYMISWMKYDPPKEINKIKVPVLIAQGTSDLQVSVDNATLLSAAKPEARMLIIENMNHVLKESGSDIEGNIATYTNSKLPLHKELVAGLTNFIIELK